MNTIDLTEARNKKLESIIADMDASRNTFDKKLEHLLRLAIQSGDPKMFDDLERLSESWEKSKNLIEPMLAKAKEKLAKQMKEAKDQS